jgi:hypothetical protein
MLSNCALHCHLASNTLDEFEHLYANREENLTNLDNDLVDLGKEKVHGLGERLPLLALLVLVVLHQLVQAQQRAQPS